MRRFPLGLAMILLMVISSPTLACTNIFVASGDSRLVGSNLDCSNYFPRIWFVPAADGLYGRYCYGTDENQLIAEGGCNDQGLFIGVNALNADTGWAADPDLPDWEDWEGWYETGVPDGILANCATVAEALAIFQGYNLLTLNRVKFLVADAQGASVVIEWTKGELVVLPRTEQDFQVSTNFVESDFPPDEITCTRFRLAQQMLADGSAAASVPGMRGLLSAVHLEFQTPTVVSSICDLKTGMIHVYYFHDFERPLVFDLKQELAQERHGGLVGEMAPFKSYVATVYEGLSQNR